MTSRWERLFADLDAQLDMAALLERDDEIADRTRREVAQIGLMDRLAGTEAVALRVRVRGTGPVAGRLAGYGADWLLLAEDDVRDVLVALPAVVALTGLPAAVGATGPRAGVARRLDLRHALRGLARDRASVLVTCVDGYSVTGVVERVGADFLDLAHRLPGEARTSAPTAPQTVATASVATVRRG